MKQSYILLACLCVLLISCKKKQIRTQDFVSNVIPVTLTEAKKVTHQKQISTSGLINTQNIQKYSFKIGGVISQMNAEEGDFILKGQLLASLSMDEINAQRNSAQLALEKAKRDFNRTEILYNDSIATLENYQDAKTQLDISIETLDQIEFNRKFAQIYATEAGFINKKLSQIGEVVGPGTPVFITNDASKKNGWILETGVTGNEWSSIKIGDPSEILIDAYPDQIIQGEVIKKSKLADPTSGSFTIEIRIIDLKVPLAIGMYATAKIKSDVSSDFIVIPSEALAEANGQNGYVYVLEGQTKVHKKAVKIQSIDNDGILLSSGVEAGQKIVLSNSAFLNESSSITIIQ